MNYRPDILRSKLSISNRADTLPRRRLTRLLSPLLHKKLALVVAGAGYGKTTLIGQALSGLDAHAVWYCLDESDADVATFLAYLCAGMERKSPDFGSALGERLHHASLSRRSRQNTLLAFLLAIETMGPSHTIIVLDDYHLIQDSPEISEAMAFLLGRMPETLHFVLIGRKEPPLKISRYRAMRAVIDIQEENLLFSADEIVGLYRLLVNRDIDTIEARRLLENTGGWAAALVLGCSAHQDDPSACPAEGPLSSHRSKRLIFQYLEENVFEQQPAPLQSFMMKTALLSHLDPSFINSLFDIQNAEEILQALCRDHLLVFPKAETGEGFAYHHLLRDFLRDRLARERGTEAIQELHRDIGRRMEQRGNRQGALTHFLEGRHFDEIRRILAGMAFTDFLNCPFGFLVALSGAIPAEVVQQDAYLLYLGAKLSSMRGEIPAALVGFKNALERFEAADDEPGALNCAKDLAFHLYLTGDVSAARQRLETLRTRRHRDPFFQVEISGYLVLLSTILGEMDAADEAYAAIRNSAGAGDASEEPFPVTWMDFCYSYRLHCAGDFKRADAMNRRVLDAFTRMGMELLLPLAHFQTALTLFYRADPESGQVHAREGLRLADKFGINDAQLAWLLYVRGLNGYGTGALAEATADASAAFEIFRRHGNAWGQATVEELNALICRERGMGAAARRHLRAGLSLIEGLGLRVTEGALALLLAELKADEGEWKAAETLLRSHGAAIAVSKFHRFRSHFLKARIHAVRQDVPGARTAMAAGLELASENHYIDWVRRQLSWAVPVLVSCHSMGLMRNDIEWVLKEADTAAARESLLPLKRARGVRVRRAANTLLAALPPARQPDPLSIRCLGAFEVAVGDRVIPRESWRNAKAATLFKYMVLKSSEGFIPKEVLLELVWPDEPEQKTRPRFHVAMTYLRKLLEPTVKRGIASSYIQRRNDGYRLTIGGGGRIDFREFTAALAAAKGADGNDTRAALALYLRAAVMYTGPLFAEDPYLEWAVGDRDRLAGAYLDALSGIIALYETRGDWRGAIEYAEKYLSEDPCAEPVYGALMRFHARLGETPQIVRAFERCRTALSAHLDCAPDEGTRSLYKALTGKKASL